jgi:hypothetical protein
MKKFVTDLGLVSRVLGPMEVYHDNNDVMTQAIEPMSHPKYEHVQCQFHLICQFMKRVRSRWDKFIHI